MKLKWLLFITLLLTVLMGACSPGEVSTEVVESESVEVDPAVTPESAYPALAGGNPTAEVQPTQAQEEADAYPAPQGVPTDTPQPAVTYPDFTDGEEVWFIHVEAMVMNGEVIKVIQTQDLKLAVTLKDGRSLISFQKEMDDIVRLIESCGDPCKEIVVETQ